MQRLCQPVQDLMIAAVRPPISMRKLSTLGVLQSHPSSCPHMKKGEIARGRTQCTFLDVP
jgi:hypothetical protein